MSKISKKYKEEVLDKYGINIDSSDRLAKKIVNKYTTVDKEGYLNICWAGKCRRTAVWVDDDFLIDELNYNWKKLTNHKGLYDHFLDVMIDELGFDIDFSMIVFVNFVLPEIYDVYFKPLEPDYISESMNRKNKSKLTKEQTVHLISLYEDMGYDRESAIDELKDLVSYFNGLNNNLKLYRIICADSEEDINLEYLGSHYSNNKKSLLGNHYSRGSVYGHCEGDKTFLVSVECDKRQMDIMETLSNNILYPNEQEITLLNKGYGCKLLNIEEL